MLVHFFNLFKESILGIPKSKSIIELLGEKGLVRIVYVFIVVALSFFHLYTSFFGALEAVLHRSIHLTGILLLVFLTPLLSPKHKVYFPLNIVLASLALAVGIYVYFEHDDMPIRLGEPSKWDLLFAAVIILLVIEASRRVIGWAFMSLVIFFLLYTLLLGKYLPIPLKHPGYSLESVLELQFLSTEGVYGIPIGVMSTYIIIFLIFAGFLVKTGMVNIFMDIANKLMGRASGGPAKAAVVSSCLVGMVTGSAAANVAITGSVTIPLMKRLGYKPSFAAAVEASVSSGGQFMPPVMGASAFIIAATLAMPYIDVCKHAFIPAVLWFFSFLMVLHFEAKRLKLKILPREEIPPTAKVLKGLYILLPIIVLVCLLIKGHSPMYAAFVTTVLTFILSFLRKETRFNLAIFIGALEYGMQSAIPVSIACAGAGIIIGAVMQSGLGYFFSAVLVKLSGGELFILLPLVLIASLILGMGMVTVAAYIIVATLVAPAMIEMGLVPIAAHFFPFYFAIISAITPPVAVASFAAAGIAGSNPWETGWLGIRLAIPALAIPFVFVTQPSLLLIGTSTSVLITIFSTVGGIICLASVVVGYLLRDLKLFERVILSIAALLFFFPFLVANLAGLGLFGLTFLIQRLK